MILVKLYAYLMIGAVILIFFTLWGVLCYNKYKKWAHRLKYCTKELPVIVADVLERKPLNGEMIYKPVFKSLDEDMTIQSANYSNLISFQMGQQVCLLVNPEDPQEFLYKENAFNVGKTADIISCFLPLFLLIALFLIGYSKMKK